MPALTMPQFSLIKDLIPQGVVIAMVAFAVNVSLAKSFARKNDYGVDSNQVCSHLNMNVELAL